MDAQEFYVNDRKAIAITSMTRIGNTIYLGLTGSSHALAGFNIDTGQINMCSETFPWVRDRKYCTKIHNSMGILSEDSLLIGEGNHFTWDGLPVTNQYLKGELPEVLLERKKKQGFEDIAFSDFCLENLSGWNRTRDDPGGKIVKYNINNDTIEVVAQLPQYCYSQSMVVDQKRNRAFGNTIPDNRFFYVDVAEKALYDFGRISEYAHHNLVIAPNGICYGGWMDYYTHSLKLLKFDPGKMNLEYTDTVILKDAGGKIAGNQGIDQWIVTRDGEVYLGLVSNSLVFQFDYLNEQMDLLGQAEKSGRIATMDEDGNGIIWMGAGYPVMHLIRFDKNARRKDKFIDCGIVNEKYRRCYFHASCYYNGKLYLGETDGFSPSLHVIDLADFR